MRSWLIQGQFHLQFHLLIYRYNDLFIYAGHSIHTLNFSTIQLLFHLLVTRHTDTILLMVGTMFYTRKPIKKRNLL